MTAAPRGGAAALRTTDQHSSIHVTCIPEGQEKACLLEQENLKNKIWNFSEFYENDVLHRPQSHNDPQAKETWRKPHHVRQKRCSLLTRNNTSKEKRIKVSTKRKKIIYLELYIQGKYLSEIEATLQNSSQTIGNTWLIIFIPILSSQKTHNYHYAPFSVMQNWTIQLNFILQVFQLYSVSFQLISNLKGGILRLCA